jgi:hypothetical protein
MTIRPRALNWLASQRIEPDGQVVASKRYRPDESWTKSKAWWVQIPESAISSGKTIHILCEAEPGSKTFRYLKVPAEFFHEHSADFATIGDDKINLFLSADEGIEFEDQRGPGRVSFARFEQRPS